MSRSLYEFQEDFTWYQVNKDNEYEYTLTFKTKDGGAGLFDIYFSSNGDSMEVQPEVHKDSEQVDELFNILEVEYAVGDWLNSLLEKELLIDSKKERCTTMSEEYEDQYFFDLGNECGFCCNREVWGDNNHLMWLPDINTEDIWEIDVLKAFRTKEKCVEYMQRCVKDKIKAFQKATWEL